MNFLDERLPARFWSKCIPEPMSGCWLWTGALNFGYGKFYVAPRVERAHRVSYQAFVGPIPDGLVIDHLCRVECCVNPAHLEAVTDRENARRGLKGVMKATCAHGHPYTAEIVRVIQRPERSSTERVCVLCVRLRDRVRNQSAERRDYNDAYMKTYRAQPSAREANREYQRRHYRKKKKTGT